MNTPKYLSQHTLIVSSFLFFFVFPFGLVQCFCFTFFCFETIAYHYIYIFFSCHTIQIIPIIVVKSYHFLHVFSSSYNSILISFSSIYFMYIWFLFLFLCLKCIWSVECVSIIHYCSICLFSSLFSRILYYIFILVIYSFNHYNVIIFLFFFVYQAWSSYPCTANYVICFI